MEIPILSQSTVLNLFGNVEENLKRYYDGFSEDFFKNNYNHSLKNTNMPENLGDMLIYDESLQAGDLDAKNSVIVYNALKGLTAYQARDGRVWTALSHKFFLEYTKKRHSEKNKKLSKTKIKQHFFTIVGGKRGFDRNNVVSRLWWNGYAVKKCSKEKNFEELVQVLCQNTDLRANIIERTGIFQIPNVLLAVLLVIKNEKNKGNEFKRALYRPWLRYIDKAGGQKMYAIMEEEELVKLFGNFLATVKTAI